MTWGFLLHLARHVTRRFNRAVRDLTRRFLSCTCDLHVLMVRVIVGYGTVRGRIGRVRIDARGRCGEI
jgi:hypothetical protein